MYYLNKAVGWMFSPLGMTLIALAAAQALRSLGARSGGSRGPRLARAGAWLAWLSVAFLWIMSCGVTTRLVGVGLERRWEREGAMHGSVEGLPAADAILVLGGGVGSHEECHAPELFDGADRVWQGARLYHATKGAAPGVRVFCTGGGCEFATVPLLVDLGVPREAISFSEEPRNTEEEARLLREVLGGERPRVLLVTSAWHMSRAKTLFERAGLEVVPAPTDFEMSYVAERPLEFGDFMPSAEALARNSVALKEWVARLGYAVVRR